MAQPVSAERQNLLDRLLDAVKQCQVRFGGKSELATDADSRVSCLCAQFEAVLQHGLKKPMSNPLSALQQMTGLNLPSLPLMKSDPEPVFWPIVKDKLTAHENQRYTALKHITTDAGRSRAWLRSTLNEHSLERYMHMILGGSEILKQYYEPWAFLLDEERSTMLPTMARGLGSILFAINIDNPELNGAKQPSALTSLSSFIQAPETVQAEHLQDQDPEPVILASTASHGHKEKKKKKGKKKAAVSIVSFNDAEGSSTTSVLSSSPALKINLGETGRNESVDSYDSLQEFAPSSEIGRLSEAAGGFSNGQLPVAGDEMTSQEPTDSVQAGVERHEALSASNSWASHSEELSPDARSGALGANGVHIGRDSSSASEDLPVSFPATTPPSTPQEVSLLDQYERIRNSMKNHEMEITRQQMALVNGVDTPNAANSDPPIHSRELYSAFPAKTPPSTPLETSTLAQYERLRNSVDATEVSDQLRQDITISTPEGTTTRSIYDTYGAAAAARESLSNGDDAEINVEEAAMSTTKRESLESGDRMSPALSRGSFHLLGEESDEAMFPVAQDEIQSNDSSVLAFGAETENATMGLVLAQKGLTESSLGELSRTEETESLTAQYQSMSSDDLRQALLAAMNRSDDLLEKNRSLRALLDSEMEHSASLRGQLEELHSKTQESEEKLDSQVQALTRENELLKNQLKKYVAAVQMLRREGSTGAIEGLPGPRPEDLEPAIPEPSSKQIDYSEQASQYEHKLIQVAEMHGELMEFNDYLSRQLKAKDALIKLMREELIDLRGPLPEDRSDSEVNSPDSETASLAPATRALINLWIPSAFLRGKGKDAFHVYQIYVRIRDEEWNVYRRYSQFRELHQKMKKAHAVINTFEFPPKKAVGNKDVKFVEERRKRLQHYLRLVINFCVQNSLELTETPSKETLISLIPFFGDSMGRKSSKGSGSKPRLMAGRRGNETPTYEGL